MGGVTPEQMDAFAERDREVRAARQGPHHHPPEHPDPPRPAARRGEADPRDLRRRPLLARGLRQHVRNVTGDPCAGVSEGELFDITPTPAAYVRYFVRHPTTQLMPRKVKTAFTATDEDVAITGIHDIGFIPRERDGVRGVEIRVGGGTSIMPRVAPTLYEFVELDNGDYLKVSEAVLPDLRPPGVAARQPRPRADQGPDRQDRHRRLPRDGRGGARGRLGRRARLLDRPPRLRRSTRRPTRPAPPPAAASPNGDRSRVRPLPRGERPPAAPGGLHHGRGQGHPRRPDPGAVPRPRRRSCASTPAARRAPPCIRTSSCAGSATRRVYDVWQRLGELGLGDAGRRRDHRRRLLPRHRQLQARDHQLDGPQPRRSRSGSSRCRSPTR